MDERTAHVHECQQCGIRWGCEKPDCNLDDVCTSCDLALFETYAEQHHWTESQPVLPELAHAMRGKVER